MNQSCKVIHTSDDQRIVVVERERDGLVLRRHPDDVKEICEPIPTEDLPKQSYVDDQLMSTEWHDLFPQTNEEGEEEEEGTTESYFDNGDPHQVPETTLRRSNRPRIPNSRYISNDWLK